nr:kelch-like protein 40 isoform X2 [Leptinotarsa decemlineata]
MSAEKIVLEIENTEVICRKQTLIENSDYFRTMFEGNFIERKMKKIKLQDVDLKAMEIILRLVENRSYAFENEDILMILHVADMLQFVEIFDSILHEITEILSPIHCLKIWQATEQLSIKPLYLKAKSMALDKFMEVKETECILELSLGRLCGYVGHVHLRADNEFHVFQTVMNWWQANNNWNLENCDVTLLKLLSCIDYQNLDDGYIKEMMEYSGISDNNTIKDILLCLFNLRNGFATDGFSQSCQEKASLLLNSTRSRSIASCPCILVKTKSPYDDGFIEEKSESEREKTEFHVLYYDLVNHEEKKTVVFEDISTNIDQMMVSNSSIQYNSNIRNLQKNFDKFFLCLNSLMVENVDTIIFSESCRLGDVEIIDIHILYEESQFNNNNGVIVHIKCRLAYATSIIELFSETKIID